MAKAGFFFVIEGMDGAGKSSIARHLHEAMAHTHRDRVARTYQPHDPSAAGVYIREILAKRSKASPLALALAFALNRADHLDTVVNPFLAAGDQRIVICDRYVLSSLVYQSSGGLSMDDVLGLNRWARRPDLTVYLDVSPHQAYARMRQRPTDRELFERNLSQRAEKYRQAIELLRAQGETIVEVDANKDFDQALAGVFDVLKTQGPAWLHFQPPLLLDWRDSTGSA
jgi:dTMP kinase